MLGIQANTQGHPVVIELRDGNKTTVDAERWQEILDESGDKLSPNVICPVQIREPVIHEASNMLATPE